MHTHSQLFACYMLGYVFPNKRLISYVLFFFFFFLAHLCIFYDDSFFFFFWGVELLVTCCVSTFAGIPENFRQINLPLFSSFAADCNVACSLHTILAFHIQMWKIADHIISERKQSHLLATALRAAGCDKMAFQVKVVNVNWFSFDTNSG